MSARDDYPNVARAASGELYDVIAVRAEWVALRAELIAYNPDDPVIRILDARFGSPN